MAVSPKAQKTILVSSILASSMAYIDGTALNVALPSLQKSLDLTAGQLLWVVNAYVLFLAALILLAGSLGDIYGKKKVFSLGILFFTIFSACCGFSPNGEILIVSRGLQGVGGAFMIPGSLSIISAAYPQKTRGSAIGTWSMFSAFTTLLGPVLGGYLASQGLWRYIFFINIPFGIVCLYMLSRVPEPVEPTGQKADWKGGVLITLALSLLTFGFIQASENGFKQPLVLSSIGLGFVLLIAFLWVEKHSSKPMLPLKLFQSPTFSAANALTLLVYGALGAVLFFLPLNLIQIQGYSEDIAGYALLPFAGLIALLARISGSWTDKTGAKLPLIIGPVITGIAFFTFSLMGKTTGADAYFSTFFIPLLLGGIGMGLTVVPLTTAVMNCVSDESTGIASGVNNTVSRFANVLTLAVLGSFLVLSFKANLMDDLSQSKQFSAAQMEQMEKQADKLAEASAPDTFSKTNKARVQSAIENSFLDAYNLICKVAAGLCFVAAVISFLFIKTKPKTVALD